MHSRRYYHQDLHCLDDSMEAYANHFTSSGTPSYAAQVYEFTC